MSALPLVAKKDLRDHWEKKQPEFLEKLKKASGVDWTFDINVEEFYANIGEESRKAQVGQVIVWNIEGLVNNLVKKMADDMVKQSVLASCPKKIISLSIGDVPGTKYQEVLVKDGGIHVIIKKEKVATNVDQIGSKIEEVLTFSTLPLVVSKNIRDNWEKKEPELLAKLKTATGVDWKFDINFQKFHADIADDRKAQVGGVVFWSMEGLVNNLVKKAKDDMVKEALVEACPNHVIAYYIGETKSTYHEVLIKDGGIHVVVKKDKAATNVDQIGSKIETLL